MRNNYSRPKFLLTFCIFVALAAAVRHLFSIHIPMREFRHIETEQLASLPHDHRPVYVDTTLIEELEDNEIAGDMTDEADSDMADEADSDMTDEADSDMADEADSDMADEADSDNSNEDDDNANEDIDKVNEADGDMTNEAGDKPGADSHKPLRRRHNRIKGVWSYDKCFPDLQDTQIIAAEKNGITPVRSRQEAETHVKQHTLVNITHSPYYVVDDLTHSMPYLVPKAHHLLNTIGINFIDSCMAKGVPVHLLMVTSVLRTADDVAKLQRGNQNATTNSCHCYGTTVDIAYNRFLPVAGGYTPRVPLLRWDEPMKRILSEVLFDLRNQGLCYVKYERKQGCFHLTCR